MAKTAREPSAQPAAESSVAPGIAPDPAAGPWRGRTFTVDPAAEAAAAASAALRITARAAGFRRAGAAHAATPTDWPAGAFSADEVAQLLAEPMLIVERVDAPPAPVAGPADAPTGEA